ncbi:23S rRNA (uracil(747)-C(5))-methyltransferase RlmC [Photobacterium nomapromontoriensis]|uniref:23S rRNA (uracil(747)-C(5))-methyltransferase RlmC n=1 Tax=Photobacterium nomapromontoriensis TaxID=2910237 RepID=UPI003D0B79FC
MQCPFYIQQQCQSCEYSGVPYQQQIMQKDKALNVLFSDRMPDEWRDAVTSDEIGCRNKAKMVVLGAAHAPILGADIQKDGQSIPVSLVHCPLYPEDMQALLAYLQDWIRIAGIPPYNKVKKKGELKYILLTRSEHHGEFMLRFVLRSRDAVTRIENNLSRLLEAFPQIKVVSINLQPIHMARLEGDEEFFLTQSQYLIEQFNDVPMVIRPKSFFQTNPKVAAQLYATARNWVREIAPERMWDLFCGVGGFALHCASDNTAVTGIEIEPEAIASAKRSAEAMGITNLDFDALDSAKFSLLHDSAPELVLVNPPRRGLGKALTEQLVELSPKHIIYSSCNPETLKADLDGMPNYHAKRLQWFDMFPHTEHAEVMVLLEHQDMVQR